MDVKLIHILLVEDNPGDVRLLREVLQDARTMPYQLSHVVLLADAIQRLGQGGIDVVLLDLSLPDATGLDTVKRTVAAAPQVPIVILTGLNDEGVAVQALRQGAQDYLVKGQGDGHLVMRSLRYAIERKRAELEHQRLEAQLQNAQRLESLGILAGGIAHDFNNLLTIITCNAQFLHQTLHLDSGQETAIQDIETAAANATEMTKSLLAFSRPTKPQVRPVNVNELTTEIHRFLRRVFPATIEFRLDLAVQPIVVAVDPGQMQQVLINLCLNARDAMPTGGTLDVQTRHVRRVELPAHLQAGAAADTLVRIRVEDSGMGMDADTLRQIFDPFFTTKSKDRGTGLGLAIVYKIVEIHQGLIDVDSKPGQGSRFDVYFPAVQPEVERGPDPSTARGHERILILDDEDMIASLMKTLLESRGYQAVVTTRPEQALDLARSSDGFDLAVVDFHMPNMTGDVCLTALREIQAGLPAILITGDSAAVADKTDQLTRLLAKPFTANALAGVVREMLDQRARA